jgi:hypothetical protein
MPATGTTENKNMNEPMTPADNQNAPMAAASGAVLGQQIKLHPKIADLVNSELVRCMRLEKTQYHKSARPPTADEIVNEILWISLRSETDHKNNKPL